MFSGLSFVSKFSIAKHEFKYPWLFLKLLISLPIESNKLRLSTLGDIFFVYKLLDKSNTLVINSGVLSLKLIHLSNTENIESKVSGGISSLFGVFLT